MKISNCKGRLYFIRNEKREKNDFEKLLLCDYNRRYCCEINAVITMHIKVHICS